MRASLFRAFCVFRCFKNGSEGKSAKEVFFDDWCFGGMEEAIDPGPMLNPGTNENEPASLWGDGDFTFEGFIWFAGRRSPLRCAPGASRSGP